MSDNVVLSVVAHGGNQELNFLQGAAQPYFALHVRAWPGNQVPSRWIRRGGQRELPP